MSNTTKNTYHPTNVTPPGHTLKDVLEERGLTQSELATRMGRPEKTISEIINGKAAITAETAIQLEFVLDVPASFWNNRESNYREFLAREDIESRLAEQVEWMSQFPIKEMKRYRWIERKKNDADQVRELLQFYGVISSESWDDWHSLKSASFRKSASYKTSKHSVSAWLRKGEREAEQISCAIFDRKRFRAALTVIRGLSQESPDKFLPKLRHECSTAGVAFVLVRQLPKSGVSGVTRWLSPGKSLIQLSLRYKTDDHFWFTFFHEAAHVLFHSKKTVFLEENGSRGREEDEANDFAARFLIPDTDYEQFISNITFSKDRIRKFAKELGISPGIVVGRLQHDGHLPFSHCNDLKRKFIWNI